MATEQEVTVIFHLTYGKLEQKADDIVSSATRDFNTIKDYGITQPMIDLIGTRKARFISLPTDVEMGAEKVGKTRAKDAKAAGVRAAVKQIVKRVGLKFGKASWQYKKFKHGDLSRLSDSDLCRAANAIVRTATEMLADTGLKQAMIDLLRNVNSEFDTAIDEQRDAEKARDKATQDRRIAANDLYLAITAVSNAGKVAFEDTNEALYNDYVIYETPTGNKIKAGTGMLTGEITDQDGVPMPEVTVTVKGTTFAGVSDANGQYIVEGITVGSFTVEAYKTGYNLSSIDDVTIAEGIASELDFDLVKEGMEVM
jgi:hypothetical protein